MSTETENPPIDETADIVPVGFTSGPFTLLATIKATSSYYGQGLTREGKPYAFEIERINDYSDYRFEGNGNYYQAEDLTLWIKNSEGKLTRLT
ncbi:hypothetical protein OpiT1DRAFT_01251 [Opitutaceae bacterium TAV1]|nr:hypothetical protein OpiT1DRAFT_01251 [Opitutaceae bacterium TAV1]